MNYLSLHYKDEDCQNLNQLFSTCKQRYTTSTYVTGHAIMICPYLFIKLNVNETPVKELYLKCRAAERGPGGAICPTASGSKELHY